MNSCLKSQVAFLICITLLISVADGFSFKMTEVCRLQGTLISLTDSRAENHASAHESCFPRGDATHWGAFIVSPPQHNYFSMPFC